MAGILIGAIGLTTGTMAGVIGAGGGFLTLTLLLAAGMAPKQAVGTALVFVLVIAAWSSVVHLKQGTADPVLAATLGFPAAITSFIAARTVENLPDRVITVGFLVLIVLVTLVFLRTPTSATREALLAEIPESGPPPKGRNVARSANTPQGALSYTFPISKAAGGGALVGVMQGLFGVGGGFMLVPYMVSFLRIPENVAVGVSLMSIVIGSISGSVAHFMLGNVDAGVLGFLIPGGLVGSFLGARLSGKLQPSTLRLLFILAMTGSGIYLLARELL